MSYFDYAVKLNADTVDSVSRFAQRYGWEFENELEHILWDHLADSLEVYVTMCWNLHTGTPEDFGFLSGNIFDACWHFTDGTRGPFQRIWKNLCAVTNQDLAGPNVGQKLGVFSERSNF